jgi:hypothetical protein
MVLLAGGLAVLLAGCQSGFLGVGGGVVAAEKRIPFSPGGPHRGVHKDNDFLLVYSYVKDGRSLQISGIVELRGGAEGFGWLDRLFARAYFYGADGRILESRSLLSRSRGRSEESWRYAKTVDLPPGAAGMAFGYSGRVRGVGFDAPTWDFWGTPFPE